jgi:hypothetical protein
MPLLMPLLLRILLALSLAAAPAAHAGGLVIVGSSGASGLWLALAVWAGLQPRPAPPEVSPHHLSVSPHHLSAPPPRAADSCTFVAGVRHCPRAEPR